MQNQLKQNDIYSIDQVKRYATGYFFSPDTMRFWKSRVSEMIYNGVESVYFVTSECGLGMPRSFTVRRFELATRSISTVEGLSRIGRNAAHGNAARLAQNEIKNNAKKS